MDLTYVLFTIGGIPLFSSRVFITAFAAAMLARFKPEIFLEFPAWVTADGTLFALGALALLENRITKSPEVAELFSTFDPGVKAFGQFFFSNMVLASGGFAIASTALVQAGFGTSSTLALFAAAGVWFLAVVRNRVLSALIELDEDDDLGVRRLLSWAEDGWAGLGMVFLVFFPLVALAISGLTALLLLGIQRYLQAREERAKVPCAQCSKPNYPTALECFHCRRPIDEPRRMGVFGQATPDPVTDANAHRLDLMTRRRCIVCASRLPKRSVRQTCPACGTENFNSPAWAERYMEHLRAKLPRTLLISFAFSFVPFFGLIPGIIYYRLSLISGIRTYIPRGLGCMTRWGVRLVNTLLLAFQWVPVLGAATLPLMCWVNYSIYGKVLERELSIRVRARSEQPLAAVSPTS